MCESRTWGSARVILGLYRDNGQENGNYWGYRDSIRVIGYILGLYRDNGKNGNYYLGLRFWGSARRRFRA